MPASPTIMEPPGAETTTELPGVPQRSEAPGTKIARELSPASGPPEASGQELAGPSPAASPASEAELASSMAVEPVRTKEELFAQRLIRELEELELVFHDGIPMESPWHRFQMNLLIELTHCHLLPGEDFYVGGNMFIYFNLEQARNRDYRGPDYFLVLGVDGTKDRDGWVVWLEGGRYPDLIVELLSPSTRQEDLVTKKRLYQDVFRTPEYFCYGREGAELMGWRLDNGDYHPIPASPEGRLWSETLGAFLGPFREKRWGIEADWLHLYDGQGNLVPTAAEAEKERAEAAEEVARSERDRAEAEKERAEAAEEVARSERDRAEAEKERAEAAERRARVADEQRERLLARIHELEAAKTG